MFKCAWRSMLAAPNTRSKSRGATETPLTKTEAASLNLCCSARNCPATQHTYRTKSYTLGLHSCQKRSISTDHNAGTQRSHSEPELVLWWTVFQLQPSDWFWRKVLLGWDEPARDLPSHEVPSGTRILLPVKDLVWSMLHPSCWTESVTDNEWASSVWHFRMLLSPPRTFRRRSTVDPNWIGLRLW